MLRTVSAQLSNHRRLYDQFSRARKRLRKLNLLQFSQLDKNPEWRNWQTRWTQNPVVLSTVWVRPPPPGPILVSQNPFHHAFNV